MLRQLLTQLLTSKLALTDRIISLLPKETRETAEDIRTAAVLSVKDAADAFLKEHPDKQKPESECTTISVD